MRFTRRLTRNGHSITIGIPTQFLNHLRWMGGDSLIVELTERNTLELRPVTVADLRNTRISSSQLPLPGETNR